MKGSVGMGARSQYGVRGFLPSLPRFLAAGSSQHGDDRWTSSYLGSGTVLAQGR